MKRKILSLGIGILLIVGVNAQTQFGLKGGVNFPTYSYGDAQALSKAEPLVSFYAGGYVDARLARGLYIQPEVSLQGKGARIVKFEELGGSEIIQRANWLDFVFNFLGRVPIGNIGDIFGGAGPYLGFAMNGENTYPDGSTSAVIIYKENLRSVDYGVNVLGGLKFGKRLSLNANYRMGVANISYSANKWSKNIKNQVFSLGIGVAL